MIEYNTVNVNLSNSQLNKLKSSASNQRGVTLRINIKMFNGTISSHELLLTTRQQRKLTNAFEKNMPIDICFLKVKYL